VAADVPSLGVGVAADVPLVGVGVPLVGVGVESELTGLMARRPVVLGTALGVAAAVTSTLGAVGVVFGVGAVGVAAFGVADAFGVGVVVAPLGVRVALVARGAGVAVVFAAGRVAGGVAAAEASARPLTMPDWAASVSRSTPTRNHCPPISAHVS